MRGYAIAVMVGVLTLVRGQGPPKAPKTMQGQVMQDIANQFTAQLPVDIKCKTDPANAINCGVTIPDQCQESWSFTNPCTPDNLARNITIFPHPHSNIKFLMCGDFGKLYIVHCPRYEIYHKGCRQCVAKGSKLTTACEVHDVPLAESIYVNPCTHEAILSDKLFFPFPNNLGKYIHCDAWGKAWEMICTPGEVWDQYKVACVNPDLMNPCIRSLKDPGFLFKHPCDPTKYVRCDADLIPYEIPCTRGDIFSETNQVCQSPIRFRTLPKNICGQYRFRFRSYSPATFKVDPIQQLASTSSLHTSTSGMPAGAIKPDGNINTLINAWQDTVKPVDLGQGMTGTGQSMTGTGQGMTGIGQGVVGTGQGIEFGTVTGTGGGFNTAGATGQSVGIDTGMQGGAIVTGQGSAFMSGQGGSMSGHGSAMMTNQGAAMTGRGGSMTTGQGAAFTSTGGVDITAGQAFGATGGTVGLAGSSGTTGVASAGGMPSSAGTGVGTQPSGTGSLMMVGDFASSSGLNAASGVLNSALAIQEIPAGMGSSGVDQNVAVGGGSSQSSGALDPFATMTSGVQTVDLSGQTSGQAAGVMVDSAQSVVGIDPYATITSGVQTVEFGGQGIGQGAGAMVDMTQGGANAGQAAGIMVDSAQPAVGIDPYATMTSGVQTVELGGQGIGQGAGIMVDSAQSAGSIDPYATMTSGVQTVELGGQGIGQDAGTIVDMTPGVVNAGQGAGIMVDSAQSAGSMAPFATMTSGVQTVELSGQANNQGAGAMVDLTPGGPHVGGVGNIDAQQIGIDTVGFGAGATGVVSGGVDTSIGGSGQVTGGSGQVDMMGGGGQVDMMGGGGQVNMMVGGGHVDMIGGGGQVDMLGGSGQVDMMGGGGQVDMMGGTAHTGMVVIGGSGPVDVTSGVSMGSQTGAVEFGTAGNTIVDTGLSIGNAQSGAATDGMSGIDALASAVAGIIDTTQPGPGVNVADSAGSQATDPRYTDTGPIVDAFAPTNAVSSGAKAMLILEASSPSVDATGPSASSFSNTAGTVSFGTETAGTMGAASSGHTGVGGVSMADNTGTVSDAGIINFLGKDAGSMGTSKFDTTGSMTVDNSNPGSSGGLIFGPIDASGSSGTAAFETIAVGSASPQSMGVDASGTVGVGSTGSQFTGAEVVGNTGAGSMGTITLDTSGAGSSGGTMFDIGTGSINNIFDSAGGIDSAKLRSLVGALFDQKVADGSIGTATVDASGTGAAVSAGSVSGTTGAAMFDTTGQAGSVGSTMFDTTGQSAAGTVVFDTQGTGTASSIGFESGVGSGGSVGIGMTGTGSSGAAGVEHSGMGGVGAIVFNSMGAGSGSGSSSGAAFDNFGSGQPQSNVFDNTGSPMTVDALSSSSAIGVGSGAQEQFRTNIGQAIGVVDVGVGTGMESNLLDHSSRGAASGIGQSSFIDTSATGTGGGQTSFVGSGGATTGSAAGQASFVGEMSGGATGKASFVDFSGTGTGSGSQASFVGDNNMGVGNAGQVSFIGEMGGQGTGHGSFVDVSGGSSGAGQFVSSGGAGTAGGVSDVIYQPDAVGTSGVSAAAGNTIDVVVDPSLVGTVSVGGGAVAGAGSAGNQVGSAGGVVDFGVSGTQFLTTDGSHGAGQQQAVQGFTGQGSAAQASGNVGQQAQAISVGTPGADPAANFNAIREIGSMVGGQLVESPSIHPALMREYTYSDRPFSPPCTKPNLKHFRTHFKLANNPHSFIQCDHEGNMYVMKCSGALVFDVLTRSCYQPVPGQGPPPLHTPI